VRPGGGGARRFLLLSTFPGKITKEKHAHRVLFFRDHEISGL
jgi:hypothetical protein